MKQFFVILYLLVPVLVGLTSCSDSEDVECIPTGDVAHKAWLSVPSNSSDLTSIDIDNIVAKLRETTSKSRTNDYSVSPITNKNDEAIAYVLNFGTDDGFIVLSANKKNFPLIASSESGHIDLDSIKDTPAWDWIYEMASIEPSAEMPDSVSFKISRAWDEITTSLKPYTSLSGRSTGDPYIDSVTESAIAAWREQGYEVIAVKDANVESLPVNVRTTVKDMYDRHNDDEMEKSFILIKDESQRTSVLPMITAQWHYGYPYNASISLQRPLYTPVVSVAKIMHFHDYPSEYNLSSMPLSLTDAGSQDPLPMFLLSISRLCGFTYIDDTNITYTNAATQALRTVRYDFTVRSFSSFDVCSSLKRQMPVIMNYKDKYASWICDGYSGGGHTETYRLATYTGDLAEYDPTLAFAYRVTEYVNYYSSTAYHMDFFSGITGYYYDNKWNVNFPSGSVTINSNEVTVITDISPQ